jgi:hypothetical protein
MFGKVRHPLFLILALHLGGCGQSASTRAMDNHESKTAPPRAMDSHESKTAAPSRENGDPVEWALLHDAESGTNEGFGPLAGYYERLGAWDEFSAVRSRMLENLKPGPGPIPGGPFPRIGISNERKVAPTVLSRWLNKEEFPELFEESEVNQRQLEAKLRALPPSAANKVRLADLLCSELVFDEAVTLYEQVVAEQGEEAARARRRLDDLHRIHSAR